MVRCLFFGRMSVWEIVVVVVLVVLDVVVPREVVVVDELVVDGLVVDGLVVALPFKLTAKTTMEVTIKPIIRTAISAVRNFFTGVARLSGTPPVSILQLVTQRATPWARQNVNE
jgi:hypothetical protein